MPNPVPHISQLGKRARLASLAEDMGVLSLWERWPRRPCLIALNYHRIGYPQTCDYDRAVFDATPEQFAGQLDYLKRHFRVVRLDEAVDIADGRRPLREPLALITFDDGYLDNHDLAVPLLKERGLQATFFIPTDFMDRPHVPYWDQIAYVIRRSGRPEIALDHPAPVRWNVAEEGLEKVIWRALRLYKSPAVRDSERFMVGLEKACGVQRPNEADPRLFMNWNEVKDIVKDGMAVGSHTVSHRILAKIPESDQREELSRSRAALQERLDAPVEALAYPDGTKDSFSDVTRRVAHETGYRCAFSYYGGVNLPGKGSQPFDMRRIHVDIDMTFPMFRQTVLSAASARPAFLRG